MLAAAQRVKPAADVSGFARLQTAIERMQFKFDQRGIRHKAAPSIALPRARSDAEVEQQWVSRRSLRTYLPSAVALESLAGLLGTLRRMREVSKPYLELYLFVKPARIEGLEGGTYRYDTLAHTLTRLGAPVSIDSTTVPRHNRAMFDEAAFALLVIGHMERIAPLYGSQSELLCQLEAGRLCQILEDEARVHGLGLCQAGFDFSGLEAAFDLSPGEVYVHALVGGRADWSGRQSGWAFLAEALPRPSHPKSTDAAALRAYCAEALPVYMVPMQIQIHEALPLNANGKVDRGALSKHVRHDPAKLEAPLSLSGPSDRSIAELTALVSRVAATTFDVREVLAETLFTEIGLDSLLALRFRDRLARALDRSLPATLVYDYPSVAAIVRALTPASEAARQKHVEPRDVQREPASDDEEWRGLSGIIREIGEDSLLDLAERMLATDDK